MNYDPLAVHPQDMKDPAKVKQFNDHNQAYKIFLRIFKLKNVKWNKIMFSKVLSLTDVKNWSKLFLDPWIDLPRSLFEFLVSGNLSNKNLETRSEHLKILPLSDLVQTWCMFRLDMDMSESGLRQVWILSQKQICSRSDSDLEHIFFRSEQICTRSDPCVPQVWIRPWADLLLW